MVARLKTRVSNGPHHNSQLGRVLQQVTKLAIALLVCASTLAAASTRDFEVHMAEGNYPNEVSWRIGVTGTTYKYSATRVISLQSGEQTLYMLDSVKDGWDDATWTLKTIGTSAVVAGGGPFTLSAGSSGSTTFTAWTAYGYQCVTNGGNNLCKKTDGTWVGFGYNDDGQLGLGDTSSRNTPTAITGLGNWWWTSTVELCVVGGAHSLCKKTDGTWVGFGRNLYGQLGLGDTSYRYTPTAITGLGTSTVECVVGYYHTLCKKTDGTWVGFGDNFLGQLGLGDTSDRWTPTAITGLGTSTVELCVSGYYHNLCKKTDGTWVGFWRFIEGQL
jgi:hypothetical protein